MGYGVVAAWVGSPPDLSLCLNEPSSGCENSDQGFKILLESVYTSIFNCDGGDNAEDDKIGDLSWFIVSGSIIVDHSGKVGYAC